ncbi:hypothetical protein phiLdb_00023 [Lactobacillus phage phiLdb]|uniref:Uncharacterized protein n=1 Tax=Lactobacillus phage phiLdb TaxID=1399942 RepID=U3PIX4_9CAUD|nr:hypothetical protein phiLdb_00023 [Lactobacillus phage phiLdb]AGW43700.1 hypothetical protein phiLdb_00023 [Lactobacillus phage phiLdb]
MKSFIEQIKVADVVTFVIGVVTFLKAVEYLAKDFYDKIGNSIMENTEPINRRLDMIEANINKIDKEQCKSFLTQYLNVDRDLKETEKQRIYEVYQHYRELGGNSYIKEEFEKMQDERKL